MSVAGAGSQGVLTISPIQSVVPSGEVMHLQAPSLELTINRPFVPGSALLQPTPVEIVLTNARVLSGGGVDVGAGAENRYLLELDGTDATIIGSGIGSGTLVNKRVLSGTGRVEVPTINAAGGEINMVSDALTFTQAVTNASGAMINGISSTLTFPGDGLPTSGGGDNSDGLTNNGDLNLINTTIEGDVHSPAGSTITVGGGVVFEGLVSGGGIFPGAGGVTFNGGYAPGDSPALVSLSGDLTLGDTNTLYIEIGGTTAGTEYDRIEADGFVTLAGELDVTLTGGFTPSVGDNFGFVMANGGFDASFSSLNLPDLSSQGLGWQLNPGGATLFLEVVAALAGDYNANGIVDAADYTVWRDSLGQIGSGLAADGDGNGVIEQADYTVWQTNFGNILPASATSSSVPEPSALFLMAFAVSLGLLLPRHNN